MARKILLADDSVTAQNMGRRILVEAGYEVVTVNNGSAALKKIAEQPPDLIILDVYMPGYSGLEVCQRVKAAPETASIPVLLTVGKLEPFKAEESRKVFADAFIIKPFEATELVGALTKLEEKIVPQASAKAAPAKAAPAPIKDSIKKQEDQEWKDRLRIQSPAPVVEESPAPAPAAAQKAPEPVAAQFHDIRNAIAAAESDEAIAENLPPNVTSEELEAITAAVSAFSDQEDAADAVDIEQVHEEVRTAAKAPQEIAEVPEPPADQEEDEEVDSEPAIELSQEQEEESLEAISPWANPQLLEEVAAALDQPHTELVPQVEVAAAAPVAAAGFTDSEVDAALASLGGDDIMARLHAEEQAHVRSLDYVDAQAAASWSQESAAIGSTKWIAQEMRLEENEAAVILEEEMQKARAALLQQAEEARVAALQMQAMQEAAAEAARVQEEAKVLAEARAAEARAAEVRAAEVRAKEIADQEAAAAQAVSSIEVAAPQAVEAPTVESEGNTFAAAASAGAGTAPAHVDAVADEPAKQEDPELAAAWARWRQIRESVASPQFVSQVANVATAEIQNAQPEPTNGAKAAAPSSEAIASIVDSVLAQLKPKLVEEIAKQLSEKK